MDFMPGVMARWNTVWTNVSQYLCVCMRAGKGEIMYDEKCMGVCERERGRER